MSLPAPATISRRTRQTRGTGFERLRALGLDSLQRTSGQVWTDHNLHDPGITMLEALCYAISELAYRSEFPVADLLTGPDGRLDFEALALHPPQQALPCHATTLADHRRRLLDRVAGLDDVRLLPDRKLPGVLLLQVKPSPNLPAGAPDSVALVQQGWRAERPLGEDLAPEVGSVADHHCALCATLEVAGSADPAEVLAEVYYRAAAVVDRAARLSGRRELHERGFTLEQLHDGPVVEHGFMVAEHRGHAGDAQDGDGSHGDGVEMLYIDDISRELGKVTGVKAVLDLSLLLKDGSAVRSLTPWGGDAWALRLHVPGGGSAPAGPAVPAHLQPLQVKLQRRTHELPVDAAELWRRVQDLRANARGQRLLAAHTLQDEERARLPTGRYRPPADYLSVQHHFPAIYGLGVHGVPDSYGKERQARALQLQAYLMLFDQVLANGLAQLSHVHELFSAKGGGRKTQWWQVLGPGQVPGLDELLEPDPDLDGSGFEDAVLRPLDSSAKRKLRLLDHLLALHGEDLPQHAMRLHCAHLGTAELDALLVRNKAAWLKDVVLLARQRAGGFDDRRAAWRGRSGGDAHNTSGLARRLALLLGFEQVHARPLCAGLARHGWALGPRSRKLAPDESEALAQAEVLTLPSVLDVPRASPARPPKELRVLHPLQWRAAMGHDHFTVLPRAAEGRHRLFVGPDDSGPAAWWPLGDFQTAAQARSAAHRLRSSLLSAHAACEGLHLVEHVLLRPVLDTGAGQARWRMPQGDQVLRLTAVFPNWTLRTASPTFQVLAEETLRLNCPAHLVPQTLWLDFAALQDFETAYRRWLVCRRLWLRGATDRRAGQMDRAAAAVLARLSPAQGALA